MIRFAKRIIRGCLPDSVYASYKRWQWLRATNSFTVRRVEHTYDGVPLSVGIEDPMAADWYDRDWPSIPELEILRDHGFGAGSRLFDLGAHQCVVALVAAANVQPDGEVIAVEAERHNFKVGQANIAANGTSNVRLVHAAASDTTDGVRFVEGLNGSMRPGQFAIGVKTPSVTIDQLADAYGQPTAVLVDVEGAEVNVLLGAGVTLRRGAMFVVEIHAGAGLEAFDKSPEDVLRFFDGYELLIRGENETVWHPPTGRIDRRSFLFAKPRAT